MSLSKDLIRICYWLKDSIFQCSGANWLYKPKLAHGRMAPFGHSDELCCQQALIAQTDVVDCVAKALL